MQAGSCIIHPTHRLFILENIKEISMIFLGVLYIRSLKLIWFKNDVGQTGSGFQSGVVCVPLFFKKEIRMNLSDPSNLLGILPNSVQADPC